MHLACSSRAVREAAAAGRVGEVIRLVRRAHGLNQKQLGVRTGRSQSTISRLERGGAGSRDVETLRRLGSELCIPLVMLGLAENPNTNQHSESPVNRRKLFGAAGAMLVSATLPGSIIADDEAAATVHAITMGHRKLDGTTSSTELAQPVLAHLQMARNMQDEIWDPTNSKAMAAVVSEIAGLAGWLHWDMNDLGSARRHYRLAVKQAQQGGGDTMLTAYMLGSLASFVVQEGEASEGLALIRHAAEVSEGQRPATADAWLAAMTAVAHASAGDHMQAWRALDRAEAAAERVTAEEPPPWPWVFHFDTRKIATHRLTCAVRLHRPDIAYVAVEQLSLIASGHRKQGALTLLDLATAYLQSHEVEEGLKTATAAVDLAVATRSERVLGRARQFRRAVPAGAPLEPLRQFDERLHAANTRDRAPDDDYRDNWTSGPSAIHRRRR